MGVAIGGAAPILFSMLSDIFPVERRNLVVAMVGFANAIGSALGQFLGGSVGDAVGAC